jgi:hypothetical protein
LGQAEGGAEGGCPSHPGKEGRALHAAKVSSQP